MNRQRDMLSQELEEEATPHDRRDGAEALIKVQEHLLTYSSGCDDAKWTALRCAASLKEAANRADSGHHAYGASSTRTGFEDRSRSRRFHFQTFDRNELLAKIRSCCVRKASREQEKKLKDQLQST